MLVIYIGKRKEYASIVVFINQDNKVLLLKRATHANFAPGQWGLVGGGSEINENPTDTAVRETYEETGLKVVPSSLVKISKTTTPDGKEIHAYACNDFEGTVNMKQVKDEHDDYRWVDVDKVEDYDTPGNTANFVKKAVSLF
jgi:8-oxo-dGTP pyrophosphatase MutT (NUDIX family)